MDGIAITNISKKFKIVGRSKLNNFCNIKVNKDECLIVKTGSLIPNNINSLCLLSVQPDPTAPPKSPKTCLISITK